MSATTSTSPASASPPRCRWPGSAKESLERRLKALAQTMRAEGELILAQQGVGANGIPTANDDTKPDGLAPALRTAIRLSVKTRTTLAQEIGISVLSLERAARGDEIDPVADEKLREFLRRAAPSPLLVSGRH